MKMVTLPMSATRARLAAGCAGPIDIEAACVGEWRTFWLWRDIGMNNRVSDPLVWQLRSFGLEGVWRRSVKMIAPAVVLLQREWLSWRSLASVRNLVDKRNREGCTYRAVFHGLRGRL